ncbi:hypothetical protein PAXRUDRAFT_826940 [Paxillus rubicundulus Ve08.2h10]|uniref:Uncharacterized protein n=1 Tax=Paxillus rubicundulus Ve08.2h10 TaxID=930991 RepID=A0A0D0E3N3_9AGAM|nr:hypothetical protein PAXRUDRAFT_826940 [Paxillus rubicundulus Ve08.2h10]
MQNGNECTTKGVNLPHEALLDGRLPMRIQSKSSPPDYFRGSLQGHPETKNARVRQKRMGEGEDAGEGENVRVG